MTPAQTSEVRARAARGHGGELRDQLLDAAEQLLVSRGSKDAVSIRSIVTEVGVTPPSLYLHFEDKDELFFEVCWRRFEDFLSVMEAAADGIDDPVERLRALGVAYVDYGTEHAEHYQILFAPQAQSMVEGRDISDGPGMKSFVLLLETVAECISTGRFREVDPLMTTLSIWAGVHGVVMLLLAQQDHPAPIEIPPAGDLGAATCDVLIRGLLSADGGT